MNDTTVGTAVIELFDEAIEEVVGGSSRKWASVRRVRRRRCGGCRGACPSCPSTRRTFRRIGTAGPSTYGRRYRMSRDEQPSAHVGPEHEAVRSLDLPPTLTGARSERRCRTMGYREVDVTDLLLDAGESVVRFHSCCAPTPAPPSVVTCARRIFEVALVAFRPPVSERIDVHVCHISGQVGFQMTALDRRSFGRLMAADDGQGALAGC